ncbi:MAG: monovalent cation/H+ antiporter complex subunit F [Actinomycetota bacterium]|nr:monovalent cation/H+ antiporter complex subunit F [Actinomycetota bacterium]
MIHEAVFYAAALWLAVLLAACAVRTVRAPSAGSRILALDTLVLVLVGMLVLWSAAEGASYLFDAALVLALLGFAGTLMAARFHGTGRVF